MHGAWQEPQSSADHEPTVEPGNVPQPVTAVSAEGAAGPGAGAATEETWRSAWQALLALLHEKVGTVARNKSVHYDADKCNCGQRGHEITENPPPCNLFRPVTGLRSAHLQGYFEAGAAPADGSEQPWGPTKRAWLSMARDRAYLIYALDRALVADVAKLDLPYTDRKVRNAANCITSSRFTCSLSHAVHAKVPLSQCCACSSRKLPQSIIAAPSPVSER